MLPCVRVQANGLATVSTTAIVKRVNAAAHQGIKRGAKMPMLGRYGEFQ